MQIFRQTIVWCAMQINALDRDGHMRAEPGERDVINRCRHDCSSLAARTLRRVPASGNTTADQRTNGSTSAVSRRNCCIASPIVTRRNVMRLQPQSAYCCSWAMQVSGEP
jgi:hypothetical protein